MYEVEVRGEFSAAHALKLYDGSFEPRHGHTFGVSVVMRAEKLDGIGVVVDFEELKPQLRRILGELENSSIADQPEFREGKLNPSTENIAKIIYDRLKSRFRSSNAQITKVTVWETPEASASFYA